MKTTKMKSKLRKLIGIRGASIIEMMVVVAVGVILAILVLNFFRNETNFWKLSSIKTDLRTRAERTVDVMVKELRAATTSAPSTPPNILIPSPPNNTQITFYLPTDIDGNLLIIDSSGNLEWDTSNPIQYQFDQVDGQLKRIEGGVERVLASEVTAVSFNQQISDPSLNAGEIRLSLTLERSTLRQRVVSVTSGSVVALRN